MCTRWIINKMQDITDVYGTNYGYKYRFWDHELHSALMTLIFQILIQLLHCLKTLFSGAICCVMCKEQCWRPFFCLKCCCCCCCCWNLCYACTVLFPIECSQPWVAPVNWTGDQPVVCRSFENENCLDLINGAEIVPGKVPSSSVNLKSNEIT